MTGIYPWVPADAIYMEPGAGPSSLADEQTWGEWFGQIDVGRVATFGFGLAEYFAGTAMMAPVGPKNPLKLARYSTYVSGRLLQLNGFDDMVSAATGWKSIKARTGESVGIFVGAQDPERVGVWFEVGTGLLLLRAGAGQQAMMLTRAADVGPSIGSGQRMSNSIADAAADGSAVKYHFDAFGETGRLSYRTQKHDMGCIAACVDMVSQGRLGYDSLWNTVYKHPFWQSASGLERAAWLLRSKGIANMRMVGEGADMFTAAMKADTGARFMFAITDDVSQAGHVVVANKLSSGRWIIRDPGPGAVYSVDASWIKKWVAGGLAPQ